MLLLFMTEGDAACLVHKAALHLVFPFAIDHCQTFRVSDVVACVSDFIIHLEKALASLVDNIAGVKLLSLGHAIRELASPPADGQFDNHLSVMVYIAASGIFTCSTDGSQTFAEITSQLASLVDIADPLMRTIDDNSTKSLVEIVAVTLGHRIILIRNSQLAFGVDIPHLSTLVHDNGHAIAEIMGKMELKGNDNITLAIFIAIFSIFIFTGQPVRILLHLWLSSGHPS